MSGNGIRILLLLLYFNFVVVLSKTDQSLRESNGAMGIANEEYPDIKGDALLKLLPDLAFNWVGIVWTVDIGGMETKGQG